MSVYLGDLRPAWRPHTESDLTAAIGGGLLFESHYLDLKRELASTKAANRDLAQDMAALAIDSGTIIIGVDEGETGAPPTLSPVPLEGLPERVEQIARTKPDPPLAVSTSVVSSEDHPSVGYLLIHIPVSPSAPHMVDHVYFGRGDKTNIRLSDPEVERHLARRRRALADADAVLDRVVGRDPIPEASRRNAHAFLVASPLYPREEMLLSLVEQPDWPAHLRQIVDEVVKQSPSRFSSSLSDVRLGSRRSDGIALTSYALGPGRSPNPDARTEELVELELSESGEIRIFQSRLSDAPNRDGDHEIITETIPVLARQLLGLATRIGDVAGYRGTWLLGVAATGVAGLPGYTPNLFHRDDRRPRFDHTESEYRQAIHASSEELETIPGELTRRLTGRFLRALGKESEPDMISLLRDAPA